jgi:hypothetical protein
MKHIVFVAALLFTITGLANGINPITAFQPGTYLGYGAWLADDGAEGNFSNSTVVESNGWQTIQNRDGELYFYESVVDIDANGFFTAQVTDSSDPNNPVSYVGYGNCGTLQCQMTVALNNGTLQKSILVGPASSVIYVSAAIYFNDGTPNVQWEGSSVLIPANADDSGLEKITDLSVEPITWFLPGNYVSEGNWLDDNGNSGSVQSFLNFDDSGWTAASFIAGNLKISETTLLIDENGFFLASVIDVSDPSNPIYYYGYGNCGTSLCQLTVELNNGILNKSLIFDEDGSLIYCFGAVNYNDGTPNVQFEGISYLLP